MALTSCLNVSYSGIVKEYQGPLSANEFFAFLGSRFSNNVDPTEILTDFINYVSVSGYDNKMEGMMPINVSDEMLSFVDIPPSSIIGFLTSGDVAANDIAYAELISIIEKSRVSPSVVVDVVLADSVGNPKGTDVINSSDPALSEKIDILPDLEDSDVVAPKKVRGKKTTKQIIDIYYGGNPDYYIEMIKVAKFKMRNYLLNQLTLSGTDFNHANNMNVQPLNILYSMISDYVDKSDPNVNGLFFNEKGVQYKTEKILANLKEYTAGLVDIDNAVENLSGSVSYRNRYALFVFLQEFESIVDQEIPLFSVKTNSDFKLTELKFNLNIENAASFSGSHGNDYAKTGDLNTAFIKFIIETTPNLIEIKTDKKGNIINKAGLSSNFSQEDIINFENLLVNPNTTIYAQSTLVPFTTYNQYNSLSLRREIKGAGNSVDDVMVAISSLSDSGFRSLHRGFASHQSITIYSSLLTGQMTAFKYKSLYELYNETSRISISGNVPSVNMQSFKGNIYSKIFMALSRDLISHDSRNEVKNGRVNDHANLDVVMYTRQSLMNSMFYSLDDNTMKLKNELRNRVNVSINSNKAIISLYNEAGTPIEELSVMRIVKDKGVTYVVTKKDNTPLSENDYIQLLKEMGFESGLPGYGVLNNLVLSNKTKDNDNLLSKYMAYIYLNEKQQGNHDLVTSFFEVKSKDESLKVYNFWTSEYGVRLDIESFMESKSGVNAKNNIKSVDSNGRVSAVTPASNANVERTVTKARNSKSLGLASNKVMTGELTIVGSAIKSAFYSKGEKIAPSDLTKEQMTLQILRDHFIPALTTKVGNTPVNKRVIVQPYTSEKKLKTVYEIYFRDGVVPVNNNIIDFQLMRKRLIETERDALNDSINLHVSNLLAIFPDSVQDVDVNDNEQLYGFINSNMDLYKKVNLYYDALHLSKDGNRQANIVSFIKEMNKQIDYVHSFSQENGGNFNYFWGLYLDEAKINGDFYRLLGLANNSNFTIKKGSVSMHDSIVLKYDMVNGDLSTHQGFIYKDGVFYKGAERYPRSKFNLIDYDTFLRNSMLSFVNSNKHEAGYNAEYFKSKIEDMKTSLGVTSLDIEDVLKVYYLVHQYTRANLLPLFIAGEFQYAVKKQSFDDYSKKGKDGQYVVDLQAMVNGMYESIDQAMSKRTGLNHSMGQMPVHMNAGNTIPKKMNYMVFQDREKDLQLLGTPQGLKNHETYDGEQFVLPLGLLQFKRSFGSDFGFNIDGFHKPIGMHMDYEKMHMLIDKTGTHTLTFDDLKSQKAYILNKAFSIPFRDNSNRPLSVYVPVKGNGVLNWNNFQKRNDTANLTEEQIFNHVPEFRNMFDLFEYLGGFDNESVFEQLDYILSINENAALRDKHVQLVTFKSSVKGDSPVLNATATLDSKTDSVFPISADSENYLLILNKHEDINNIHSVAAFSQAISATAFGTDPDRGKYVNESFAAMKELQTVDFEGEFSEEFISVIGNKPEYADLLSAYKSNNDLFSLFALYPDKKVMDEAIKETVYSIIKKDNIDTDNPFYEQIFKDGKASVTVGIVGKLISTYMRTHTIKKTLGVTFNGLNSVSSNVDDILDLVEHEVNGEKILVRKYDLIKQNTNKISIIDEVNVINVTKLAGLNVEVIECN